MSKQIAIRLPDEVVDFIDDQVRQDEVASRAAFVQRALDRERRRLIAARDAEILARARSRRDADDLDSLADYAAAGRIPLARPGTATRRSTPERLRSGLTRNYRTRTWWMSIATSVGPGSGRPNGPRGYTRRVVGSHSPPNSR